jgi:hypothetical protein
MLLYQRDRGFKQVGKEKRQQQNEEGTPRHVEDSRRDHEERHGGNYIPSTIVE